jgi:hypothetical protein
MAFVSRKAIEAEARVAYNFTRERHRVQGGGPAFEDAHQIRRRAPKSKSAHLGKSRRFLRRCAAFFEGAQLLVRIFASKEAGLGLPQAPTASGGRLLGDTDSTGVYPSSAWLDGLNWGSRFAGGARC